MEIDFENVYDKSKIIDIRNPLNFANNSIPSSVNIPRIKLMSNPELYISKDKDYYLICDLGRVSLSCAKVLNALGYNCYSIKGGIEGLKK